MLKEAAKKGIYQMTAVRDEKTILEQIADKDVVSFDVFDTAIKREVLLPADVFSLMEDKLKGKEGGIYKEFAKLRVAAEKAAGALAEDHEVTLEEIYAQMPFSEEQRLRLARLECETELAISVPNLPIKRIYDICIQQGKKVLFISDMYLSVETIETILRKNGYTQGRLYVSSESGFTKRTGKLFRYVGEKEELLAKDWAHIGDAIASDYLVPKRLGLRAILVEREPRYNPYVYKKLSHRDQGYIHLYRHVRYTIRKHLKPLLWLFAMAVSIELYTVLDTTMLGFLKGDTAVGLYTAAIKVERIVNTLLASVGVVLIPRLSFYINQGKEKETAGLVKKGYNYVFLFSIPAAVGLFMLSDEIILLFSGSQFASAGFTMRLLTPIVVFIPFSMMTNQQTFVPMGKENLILASTSVGAITNFILNSILIPRYAENGAAVATVIAEMAVAIVCLKNVWKYFDMKNVLRSLWQYAVAAMVIPVVALLTKLMNVPYFFHIILVIPLSALGYAFFLRVMNNSYFTEAWNQVCCKIIKEDRTL